MTFVKTKKFFIFNSVKELIFFKGGPISGYPVREKIFPQLRFINSYEYPCKYEQVVFIFTRWVYQTKKRKEVCSVFAVTFVF